MVMHVAPVIAAVDLLTTMTEKFIFPLQLKFSDSQEVKVDFGPFLHQLLNPLIRKYLDLELWRDNRRRQKGSTIAQFGWR